MGTPTWPVERSPRRLSEKLRRSERWRAELLRRWVRGQARSSGRASLFYVYSTSWPGGRDCLRHGPERNAYLNMAPRQPEAVGATLGCCGPPEPSQSRLESDGFTAVVFKRRWPGDHGELRGQCGQPASGIDGILPSGNRGARGKSSGFSVRCWGHRSGPDRPGDFHPGRKRRWPGGPS